MTETFNVTSIDGTPS
ncbi:hypothetical protein, partial [Shewanella violacea]